MILKTLFRSFENPATNLADPDDWLIEALGGGTSSSGIVVNAETALEYAPVFRGVSLISGDVAKLPLIVYERGKNGLGKDRATSHPAYRLLRYKPNEFQTANRFRELLQSQAILWGNGYAFIERAKTGAPGALLPLNPAHTRPFRKHGRVFYEHVAGESRAILDASDVFHIMGLPSTMTDGLAGVSVIQKAKESLGLGMAALQFGARFFANDASPRAVLEHPGKLTTEGRENIREGWERMHRGVGNSHRTAILEEGMKLNAFSVHPEDAQLLQTREHEIRATVANFLGIPPHMLGDNTKTSYSSIEAENQGYLDRSLDPWLVKWEMESWDKLLTDRQQRADSHLIEFIRAALVRANLKDRFAAYGLALSNGIMNLDEVRDRENLNPLPDGLGKDHTRPLNLGVIGDDPPEPDPVPVPDEPPTDDQDTAGDTAGGPDPSDDEQAARSRLVLETVRRVVKRLAIAGDRAPFLEAWVTGEMPAKHRDVSMSMLEPVLAVCRVRMANPADAVADIWSRLTGDPSVWLETIPPAVVADWEVEGAIDAG